jgi:hypothetical protein
MIGLNHSAVADSGVVSSRITIFLLPALEKPALEKKLSPCRADRDHGAILDKSGGKT